MKHGKPSRFLLMAHPAGTTRPQKKAAYGSKADSRKPSTGVIMSKGAREGAADSIPPWTASTSATQRTSP